MLINIKRVISIILAIITVISILPTSAFALSWDGSSVTGSSATGSASDPGYAIRTDSDNCIGYRFSCVNSSGSMKVTKVIDVYRNTGYGNLGYSDGYKFTNKYNKKQLISRKNNSFSTSDNQTNCYKESNISFETALPAPSGMGTWQNRTGNINQILGKLGIGTVSNLSYGDKVIVEPIYDLCLRSTYHSVTVTEYALYGRYLLGGTSTGGSSATSNTWGYISRFTNKEFPNELYTPNGQGLWTAASKLTSKETFNNLIDKGYGAGIAYTETTNKTYKIKFNGNGSTSGSMSDLSMVYGTAKKLTANAFKKTGHEFVNWNRKSDGSGTSYTNRQSVNNLTSTHGATVNLYAQWNPYVLKVYYDANGGRIASSDTYKLNSEGRVYKKADNEQYYQTWTYNSKKTDGLVNVGAFGIARTGYIFNGWWCTTADGVGQIINQNNGDIRPTDINPDIANGDCSRRMYAQWNPIRYTIAFNGNGHTGGSTAAMICTYDVASNLTANGFTKTGYHFLGWNTKADGTGTTYTNQQSVLNLSSTHGSTITLYAQWETNAYSIGFDGNGHTGGSTSGMTMKFDESKALTANGYTRIGYTFKNWNTKANGTGTSYSNRQTVRNLTSVNGGTVTLYAQWNPITYKIVFNGNGHTGGSTAEMAMTYDVAANLTENGFRKTGYVFTGWNTEPDGSGTRYTNRQSVINLTSTEGAVINLYAQWRPITYTIRFNGNGATRGTMAAMEMVYNQAKNLTPNGFTRPSYNFLGWNTRADGTGTSYADKQSVRNLTTEDGATVYLYAQWEYDPELNVRLVRVYEGDKNNTDFYYGYSEGETFNDYTYRNGYPSMKDIVWFNVKFPYEAEEIQVKQYVRTGSSAWQTRIVTLSKNDEGTCLFPVQFTGAYKTINASTDSFVIEAKMDWVDENGEVRKTGAIRRFYVPVEPTVHRYRVTAYGYDGSVVATAGDTTSGKIYAGQRVKFSYHYKMDNTWTALENLKGIMKYWNGSSWLKASSSGYDLSQRVHMNKNNPVTANSTLDKYTIPLTTKLRAQLESAWAKDTEHTTETTNIDIPVIKADVALAEIILIDADTNAVLDPNNLEVSQKVTVQYVYKNNTDTKIFVEGFKDDKSQIPGVFAIPAKSQARVNAYTFKVANTRSFNIWGGVYLEGMGIGNTKYESNGSNNEKTLVCRVNHPLSLIPIAPNAPYREGTDIITSYWLNNRCDINYTPNSNITLEFNIYNGQTLVDSISIYEAIVPAENKNLIYFKWTVPEGLNGANISIHAEVVEDGLSYNKKITSYETTPYNISATPDTDFEKKAPRGFSIPSKLETKTGAASWWEWKYENGTYTKVDYAIGISNNRANLTPIADSTAEKNGSVWTMKSGYGLTMALNNNMSAVTGYTKPDDTAYTTAQYCKALLPEYKYSTTENEYRTLGKDGLKWVFRTNGSYGNVHFTPIWYPDGKYTIGIVQSDCWTPAGMITRNANTNSIEISESAYDDWYVGRR